MGLPNLVKYCNECGGNNVAKDALAEWCPNTQQWVLAYVTDESAYCRDCEQTIVIKERPFFGVLDGSPLDVERSA